MNYLAVRSKKDKFEKISELLQFAEFGKLASGFLHDLVTPLTIVSFYLEELILSVKDKDRDIMKKLVRISENIEKMKGFIDLTQKQIEQSEHNETFFVKDKVNEAIQLLAFKARRRHMKVIFSATHAIATYGNSTKIYQLILILISSMMGKYEKGKLVSKNRKISIYLEQERSMACLKIRGCLTGTDSHCVNRIFNSVVLKEDNFNALSVSLFVCKEIVENSFDGNISASGRVGGEIIFTIKFPVKNIME